MNVNFSKNFVFKATTLLATAALLGACGNSNDSYAEVPTAMDSYSYQIEVKNLTNNQPLSPALISLNDGQFMPWEEGSVASTALEKLAEGGDNSELLAIAQLTESGSYSAISAVNPTGAGASNAWTVDFKVDAGSTPNVYLSLATMLVNTNDAFTGVNSLSLQGLAVGSSKMNYYAAFDAGTEINSELVGSIPGPADGGTGYSAMRNDVDFVHIHPGIISSDDGLVSSILDASHKFDNPVLSIKVTRVE